MPTYEEIHDAIDAAIPDDTPSGSKILQAQDFNDNMNIIVDKMEEVDNAQTAALTAGLATKANATHNHAGADITSGTIDGDRLPSVSETKKGAVPATGTPTGTKFLRDDGVFATPAGGGGGGVDEFVDLIDSVTADIPTINTPTGTAITAAKARANHTGTQSADTIVDGTTNHVFTAADDTKLGTIATGATANQTDAFLLDRANHTGTQSADTVIDGSTNHVFTAADDTKLAGIATGATANSSDATLLARANHTGTQAQSTVTNLVTDLAAKAELAAVNLQTGTTYTLQSTDDGDILFFSNAAAITVTAPSGLRAGFACNIWQQGAGAVTIVGSGVTLFNRQGFDTTAGQYAGLTINYRTTTEAYLTGDLA